MRKTLEELRGQIVDAEQVDLGNILDRATNAAVSKKQQDNLSDSIVASRCKKKHKSKAKRR